MNFENLRKIWQEENLKLPAETVARPDLHRLLAERSHLVFNKIRHTLVRDLILKMLIAAVFFYIYWDRHAGHSEGILAISLAGLTVVLGILAGREMLHLRRLDLTPANVKDGLRQKLHYLGQRHVLVAHLLAASPALALTAYCLIYFIHEYDVFRFSKPGQSLFIALLISGTYTLTYLLQRRRQAVHIAHLNLCLNELDQDSAQSLASAIRQAHRAGIMAVIVISLLLISGLIIFLAT